MSRPVYIPNVAISVVPLSTQEVIQKLQNPSDNTSELLFRLPSDNIVSFTHEYLFSKGKQDNIGNEIDLIFIDPEDLFLRKFLGNNLGAIKANNLQTEIASKLPNDLERITDLRNKITQLEGRELTRSEVISELPELPKEDIISIIPNSFTTGGQFGPGGRAIPTEITQEKVKQLLAAANLPAEASADTSANPNPYLYFYYGLGNNPNDWAGPVAGQIVAAKYDYSPESGRKQIQMRFTSTYDFAGFSYLKLDQRGITTTVNLPWRCAVRFQTGSINTKLTTLLDFNDHDQRIHEACVAAIQDYIKAITSPNVNVVVILPDFGKIIKNKINTYNTQKIGTPADQISDIYTYYTALTSLGFDVVMLSDNEIRGEAFDTEVASLVILKQSKSIQTLDPRVGYEKNFEKRARGGTKLLAIKLRKELLESYNKPIDRLCTGISNSTAVKTFEPIFEVYDDPKGLSPYFDKVNENISVINKNKFNEKPICNARQIQSDKDYPTVIFGDREYLEFLLYGKAVQANVSQGGQSRVSNQLKQHLGIFDQTCFDDSYISAAADYHLNVTTQEDQFSIFPSRQYELSQQATDQIKNSKVFFLKYGVQEPNVLDFNININDFFFSLITKLNVETESLNIVIDSPGDLIPLAEFTNPDNIANLEKELNIADQNYLNQDLVNRIRGTLTNNNQNISQEELLKAILYFSTKTRKGQQNQIVLPISADQGRDLAYYSILKKLMQNAYTGTVKTLPVFRLSKVPTSLPMALFIANDPKYVPYSKGQEDSIIKALNGFWTILGFRHVISQDDVFSEFKLIKQYRLLDSALFNPVASGETNTQVP